MALVVAAGRLQHARALSTLAVVGGGAAGYFGAIEAAAGPAPLRKVKISGGGRCNPAREIAQGYPRGSRQLLGPLSAAFGPRDAAAWFRERGVNLKTEADGRMFPVTDSSQTVIDCLAAAARAAGVRCASTSPLIALARESHPESATMGFEIDVVSGSSGAPLQHAALAPPRGGGSGYTLSADFVLLATGSSREGYKWAEQLGHTISPPVPSLFTFTIRDPRIEGLAGVAVQDAEISLVPIEAPVPAAAAAPVTAGAAPEGAAAAAAAPPQQKRKAKAKRDPSLVQRGPVLITHSGVSGPAALKLSAFGARHLQRGGYKGAVVVNWVRGAAASEAEALAAFQKMRTASARREVATYCPLEQASVPKRLWKALVQHAGIGDNEQWGGCSNAKLAALARNAAACDLSVVGKGAFKDEFVTCGGVALENLDMKTMESRTVPGLHFAGEIVDVDGITGGYNFQSAWTTSWCAGHAIGSSAQQRQPQPQAQAVDT
ncbi:HI0933 family protein [Tribonema minus]|uniref:HI0933 family protein n=1 Tax=Tribonema minus TaxID=303371 RepID=A0A835ZA93_9STRA|nr:HI0933 family protein [Tribonema minus]